LSGANTFSGGVIHATDRLELGHPNALGSGVYTLTDNASAGTGTGAEPSLAATTGLTGANAITNTVMVNTNFTWGGAGGLEFSGPMILSNLNRTITVTSTAPAIISGVISEATAGLGLTKAGSGTLTLSGNNTYTGNTTVNAGALNLTGSVAGNASVASGAKLTGGGAVAGTLSVSGVVAPGSSVGELDAGALVLNPGGSYDWEVNSVSGTPGTDWDHLNVSGDIGVLSTTGSPFTIRILPPGGDIVGFDRDATNSWVIATAGGSVTNFDAAKFAVDDTAVTNDLGGGTFGVESGSLKVVFRPNHGPVASAASFTRGKNASLKIPIATLLGSFTSDADGHGRALSGLMSGGIANQTANGYGLMTNATHIFYTNALDNTSDSFEFVVTDLAPYRAGDTRRYATNTVTISVVDVTGTITITNASGGAMGLTFHGIPGYTYVIQRSSNVTFSPYYEEIYTNVAGVNGVLSYSETPPYSPAFYRVRSE
jgi:autotransporter-associated beta strand protein